jgi:OPA family sugar phosphate sensor protein UhpC-like MFS transporter
MGEELEETFQRSNKKTIPIKEILIQVFSDKSIWILALACFCIYVIRSGINDWTVVYLNSHKNYPLIEAAGSALWFEIGGLFGCLGAGWASDKLFQGKRIPYIMICTLILAISLSIFWVLPITSILVENTLLGLCGYCIFGPQALIGLASAEFVRKDLACTAYGFTGGIAYLGAAASGYPLGKIIDLWGWSGFFTSLLFFCLLLSFILVPLLNVKFLKNTRKHINKHKIQNISSKNLCHSNE